MFPVGSNRCLPASRAFLEWLPKYMTDRRLAVFETDKGITFSFGEHTYFVSRDEPFHNIARKALSKDDYIPFYVEMAKREGLGEAFRDSLLQEVENLRGGLEDD